MTIKNVLIVENAFKDLKKNKFKNKIEKSCVNTLKTFGFSNNPPRICLLLDHKNYQIWKFRIPNPESNKGSSGGFRLFSYFIKTEQVFCIYKIIDKKDDEKKPETTEIIKKEIIQKINCAS